ncbi:MAG: hypothetical protein F6J94_08215 [Moorea sp. SIO1F2]|uniref:GspMb/PilO family protein n=1 Tax=Moorena sp. SIO1F2 TaxID=2607819 RepID=UPI0013B73FB8|nr:GspMb/PilO family protein [Moorena sp. SIO1F2]NET81926.1 hypothetical protein [Moorena sp. SIO1F2]
MTYATDDDFMSVEGQEEEPEYPTAFGITFTPQVSGITFAILGLAAAVYLAMNLMLPAWQEYQTLKNDLSTKQNDLQNPEVLQKKIKQKEEELKQAKQQNRRVLSQFSTEKSMDTLLLDLNTFVKDTRGTLLKYEPDSEGINIVNDGSLGTLVDGKLKRRTVNVEIEGSFQQVQSIMRSFERLQAMLLIKDLEAQISEPQTLVLQQGRVVPGPQPKLKTSLTLEALMPARDLDKEEEEKAEEKDGKNKSGKKK